MIATQINNNGLSTALPAGWDKDALAPRLFEQQAALHPEATALIHAGQRISYGQLNAQANRIAARLRRMGAGRETLVGVCLERSADLVASLLGVWKAGGAYVPLDPAYPQERLAFMIEDAHINILLTGSRWKPLFAEGSVHHVVCVDSEAAELQKESANNPNSLNEPGDLAYVMYTSGSTGRPKGAMIEHRGLTNYLGWAIENYRVTPDCVLPVHSSISFDLTITSLYPALMTGAAAELLAEDVAAQSLLEAMRTHANYGLVKITPAHLELLTSQIAPQEAAGMTRAFVIGGENLTAESLAMWRQHAPQTRLFNEYGPTETVVGCCVHEVTADDPDNGSVPIGKAIACTGLYILDAALQPVAEGETGELYIGGAGVGRGYLNRPELTRERFLPDPFSTDKGARMYKTGDLARRRADGVLEYFGRVDDQVKIRGHRVELGEIEAVLAQHPDVRSGAVLWRPAEAMHGQGQLVACVVPRAQSPEEGPLRDFMAQTLPAHMLPARFVFLESFPLTHNGKVDRKALMRIDDEQASYAGQAMPQDALIYGNEIEAAIAAIWMELLERPGIGPDEDLFDCGAHSLAAVQAVSRMREQFEVEVQLRHVFEKPTVSGLAGIIEALRFASRQGAGPAAPSSTAQREEIEI